MTEAQARELMMNHYEEDEEGNRYYYDIVRCDSGDEDYYIFVCVRRGEPVPKNENDCPLFWVDEDGSVDALPM